ncbi:MAG: SoxR reducing system RseC family protein [Oscillospiraceae bacterium]
MIQTATVQRILDNGMAEIAVPRKSACGHDCEECAGCGVAGSAVTAQARNPIGAKAGDKVVVESSTRQLLGIVALVYCVPVALFLAGYFLSGGLVSGEGARYAVAVAGFLAGLALAVLYDRWMKKKGSLCHTIVRTLN